MPAGTSKRKTALRPQSQAPSRDGRIPMCQVRHKTLFSLLKWPEKDAPSGPQRQISTQRGFTLIEIMVAVAIVATLAGIAIPSYSDYLDRAQITKAVSEIHMLGLEIRAYDISNGNLPNDLADIGRDTLMDPYGNPYQYGNYAVIPPGQRRKDQFLVPINSDFDLYSMGPDGNSVPPLTAAMSRDDIIRANDGGYLGVASDY